MTRTKRFKDETGNRYGKLVVVRQADKVGRQNRAYWECLCDCGATSVVFGDSLRNKTTASCGCAHYEKCTTHGMTGSRVYRIWKAMKGRCFRRNARSWGRYGGRGITVCDRWLSFENFYQDMGEPPPNGSIERIDNNGDYEPANCKWIPLKEQSLNQSRTISIELDGTTMSLAQAAEVLGVSYMALYHRVFKGGSIYGRGQKYKKDTEAAIARWKSLR